jgi:hypothetical protein
VFVLYTFLTVSFDFLLFQFSFSIGEVSGEGSYIAATHNMNFAKGKGKLQFKGLYDYNEFQRQRIQH